MNTLYLLAALVCSANPLDDGTLLFLENANSVVKVATGGKIGHVAIVMADEGQPWIYEATPARVRRVSPETYYEELARINARRDDDEKKIRMLAAAPKQPYTEAEKKAMREFLAGQIGRRYSVMNYVKDKDGDGIHCAELAGGMLNASGRHSFDEPRSIHPARFYDLVQPTHKTATLVELPSAAAKETWCQRADRRWGEVWRWSCWGCGEAWSFCF
jgi:hypothetical protein